MCKRTGCILVCSAVTICVWTGASPFQTYWRRGTVRRTSHLERERRPFGAVLAESPSQPVVVMGSNKPFPAPTLPTPHFAHLHNFIFAIPAAVEARSAARHRREPLPNEDVLPVRCTVLVCLCPKTTVRCDDAGCSLFLARPLSSAACRRPSLLALAFALPPELFGPLPIASVAAPLPLGLHGAY